MYLICRIRLINGYSLVATVDIMTSLCYVVAFLMGELSQYNFDVYIKIEIFKLALMALLGIMAAIAFKRVIIHRKFAFAKYYKVAKILYIYLIVVVLIAQ